jgi:hypothetical protein
MASDVISFVHVWMFHGEYAKLECAIGFDTSMVRKSI